MNTKHIKNLSSILLSILMKVGFLLPDTTYLRFMYRLILGRKLDLNNPLRYTEKLQWQKLYDRNPLYTTVVDKYAVKKYVSSIIGPDYIIPTLGIWNDPSEIDWESLPNQFVLKTTHGGGGSGIIICKDKSLLDFDSATRRLKSNMKQDLYAAYREWPYLGVPHRVIAEELLPSDSHGQVLDYKFYCFGGIPKVMLVASDRFSSHHFTYYDMSFKKLNIISRQGGNSSIDFECPHAFEEMKSIAKCLSEGFPQVRVDLYYAKGKVYFGELTLFDTSGFDDMSSEKIDLEWGEWITLPNTNKNENTKIA